MRRSAVALAVGLLGLICAAALRSFSTATAGQHTASAASNACGRVGGRPRTDPAGWCRATPHAGVMRSDQRVRPAQASTWFCTLFVSPPLLVKRRIIAEGFEFAIRSRR